jgi:GntR family transcriptional repressor for pyruvate dehydrogenase complex
MVRPSYHLTILPSYKKGVLEVVNFQPVTKNSLVDSIVKQIKELIVNGDIEIGERLPGERELAERFKVGRSSIREAMKALSQQGLVQRAKVGTIVSSDFSSAIGDILTTQLLVHNATHHEITQTRIVLEKEFVSLAIDNILIEELKNLQKAVNAMKKASKEKNTKDFVTADMSFHRQIALASKNSVMIFLYDAITDLIHKVQNDICFDQTVFDSSCKFHQEIYDCIEKKDKRAAQQKMTDHLENARERLLRLQERGNLRV